MADTSISLIDKIRAGAVHLLTAIGVIPALLAFVALIEQDYRMALIWLGISLLVDTLDGPLARRYAVKSYMPNIDGDVLDFVIDYMTYAIIPALFFYRYGFLEGEVMSIGAAAFMMMTALYCFANKSMKTQDNFFSGFPSGWNFVALYFYLFPPAPALALGLIVFFGILTFIPIKCIHPIRVRHLRPITFPLTVAWALLSLYLIWVRPMDAADPQMLANAPYAAGALIVITGWFFLISIWRSIAGRFE
jgi:phosphatidylcholine synthase